MDRTKRLLWITICVLVLCNLGALGMVWFTKGKPEVPPTHVIPPPHPKGHQQVTIETILLDDVGFEENQMVTFRGLRNDHHENVKGLVGMIKIEKQKLFNDVVNDSASDFDSISSKIYELQKMLDRLTLNHFSSIRAICTKDQLELFEIHFNKMIRVLVRPSKPPPRN